MKHSNIYYEALTMRKHGFTLEQALNALLNTTQRALSFIN